MAVIDITKDVSELHSKLNALERERVEYLKEIKKVIAEVEVLRKESQVMIHQLNEIKLANEQFEGYIEFLKTLDVADSGKLIIERLLVILNKYESILGD